MACKTISILVPVMSSWHREELDDNEDNDRITPGIFQHLLREAKEAVRLAQHTTRSQQDYHPPGLFGIFK